MWIKRTRGLFRPPHFFGLIEDGVGIGPGAPLMWFIWFT